MLDDVARKQPAFDVGRPAGAKLIKSVSRLPL